MARLNWCLAAVISWGKFLFACFFPLRGAKRDTVSPGSRGAREAAGRGVGGGVLGMGDLGQIDGIRLLQIRGRPGSGAQHQPGPTQAGAAGTGK